MQYIYIVIFTIICGISYKAKGQNFKKQTNTVMNFQNKVGKEVSVAPMPHGNKMIPGQLYICEDKTSNLIFPYSIKSVDKGSDNILAQVVPGFSNILQLKARIKDFQQSNLTIITGEGRFYSFIVDYKKEPPELNLSFMQQQATESASDTAGYSQRPAGISDDGMNEKQILKMAERIIHVRGFLHKRVKSQKMKLSIKGLYITPTNLWVKLHMENESRLPYVIGSVRFKLASKKKIRRSSQQEIEILPIYTDYSLIRGHQSGDLIFCFKPITLDKSKELVIKVDEETGGRSLLMIIKAGMLLKSRPIYTSSKMQN